MTNTKLAVIVDRYKCFVNARVTMENFWKDWLLLLNYF